MIQDEIKQQTCFSSPIAMLHEIYIRGEIYEDEGDWTHWCSKLRDATSSDIIKIYINSCGGDISLALEFISAMKDCQALVHCCIVGDCMSAATQIFLAADSYEVMPHSRFMLHNYSGARQGKGGEMHSEAMFSAKWSEALMKDTYKDFLTEVEILEVLKGVDIWLDSTEVTERCKQLIKIREAK